jgi:UDP-N-acetylglucosamine pyrophosphorylase
MRVYIQGTRLGFEGPKGMYDIGLPSNSSLFQLYSERIVKLQRNVTAKTGTTCIIPLFIMTSPLNHSITENYFRDKNFFGLDSSHVHFFQQGTLPALTSEGKVNFEMLDIYIYSLIKLKFRSHFGADYDAKWVHGITVSRWKRWYF